MQKSSWRAGAEHKAAVSPAARATSCIQGCIRKGMAEGGGDSPLFSADNAVSGVWCPAEGAGFAQSKEEEVKERHYCYLLGQYRSLFLEVHSDETRCSGHKLQLGKMQLGIRKSFFYLKGRQFWPRLCGEAVESPSSEMEARLETALSNLL